MTLADTGEKTLKGARVKKVEKYVTGDTFLLTYGDGVADIDLQALLTFHRSHGRLATVTGVNPSARFGELRLDGDNVREFFEKPADSGKYVNGGFFVFDRKLFDYLCLEDDCDLEYGPLEEIARAGELMIFRHRGFWACMDTLRDMDYLNGLWDRGQAAWKRW